MSGFKFIDGFDCVEYFDPNTSDAKRAELRNNFILSQFKLKYPLIEFNNNSDVVRFLSVDKTARALYKGINSEFHSLTQLESAYTLEGLTEDQRSLVISQISISKKANTDCGNEIKAISDKARKDIQTSINKRDSILSKMSPYTIVSLISIENLPYQYKIDYLKISDKTLAKIESRKIIAKYKRELLKKLNDNGGQFPDGFNPLS